MKREKHTLLKKGDLWIDPDTMLPWSGIMFSTFKDSSVIEEWIPVQDGRVNGVWETFYPDSSPKSRVAYLHGVLHGEYEEFFDNGQLREQGSSQHGNPHGSYEEYYKNGQLREKGSYSTGKFEEYDRYGRRTKRGRRIGD